MVSQEKVTVVMVREALASLPGSRECADGLPPDCGFRECLHVAFWRGLKTASRRTGVPVEELEGWLWCNIGIWARATGLRLAVWCLRHQESRCCVCRLMMILN